MDWLFVVGVAVLLAFLTFKIASMFGWPWWLVAAPLWLWAVIVLTALGGVLTVVVLYRLRWRGGHD